MASGTGQSLAAPVMLLDVANGVAAIDTTLTITISLTILAGTMPGIYEGTLSLDVTPAME